MPSADPPPPRAAPPARDAPPRPRGLAIAAPLASAVAATAAAAGAASGALPPAGVAALALAAAGLAALAGWQARGERRRLQALAERLQEIARRQAHDQRLPAAGPGEPDVAGPVNRLLEDIEAMDEALRRAQRDVERRVQEDTRLLADERDQAAAASLAKTRFLANMSHELRTPLNGVIGAAQLLQVGGQGAEEQAHLIDAIRGSGTNLLGLIENILDLSRIETGALELHGADFNLVDCVEAALASTAVGARVKGLQMACIVDPALPAWRHGDATRLRQVLLNLLGNAVKFTDAGEVVLTVETGRGDGGVRLSVQDSGVGIPPEALPFVFEPFRQADEGVNRRYGGSGLGLTITRQLVEAMGGRIQVRSEPGRGTRFDIELALAPARTPLPEPPPLPLAVLYFEPHEASARALGAQLARLGCRTFRCQSAQDVQDWVGGQPGEVAPPWMLVAADTDVAWAFLEAAMPWLDPERVIGMTQVESHEADAARERLRLPRSVVKPVLRAALVSRLGAGRGADGPRLSPPGPAAPVTVPAALGTKHVLVVEDDRLNQTIVCSMLHHAGYTTTTAENGAQALDMMSRQMFDLVLMDWQMPDMDGLEVTRRLRAGAAGRYGTVVPIVALTANAFAEDRAACLAAGMNDFLTKPVLAAKLAETARRWTALPGGDEQAFSSSNFADLYEPPQG